MVYCNLYSFISFFFTINSYKGRQLGNSDFIKTSTFMLISSKMFYLLLSLFCAFFLCPFFVIIFHIMLLAWDGELSLETKGHVALLISEIHNVVIGKIAINRLSLVISTELLSSLRWSTIIYNYPIKLKLRQLYICYRDRRV